MSKYKSKKVVRDGETFDSIKEYNRWCELRLLERAGKIQGLHRQARIELIPAQYETYERYSPKTGKRLKDGMRCVEQSVVYVADFVYMRMQDNELVYEDTKSPATRTKDYIIKRKLMLWVHGIKIKEI